jgi:type-F conjugative transfer system pilin assembly protein TraF
MKMEKQIKTANHFKKQPHSVLSFLLPTVFSLFVYSVGMANEDYNPSNPNGWLWYNTKPKPIKPKIAKAKDQLNSAPSSATEELRSFQAIIREAKAKAVLHPTEENIKNYIILQNLVTNNATAFTNGWKKTLLDYPALDYGVIHSPNNNAQHIYYEQEGQKEKAAVQYYAAHYGLFFFYRGKNAVDQSLAPMVISFARENHITLISISVDQTPIEALPDTRMNHGQAEKMAIRYFPALMLVNPKNGSFIPLGYGFFSQDELSHRFLDVVTDFQEKEL